MDYILLVDNFYPDPDNIRYHAMCSEYRTPRIEGEILDGWRGYRHEIPPGDELIPIKLVKEKVCDYYQLNYDNYEILPNFHYSTEETKLTCHPSFDEYKYHVDDNCSQYAGIVYLYPNPPENSGTTIIDPNTNEKIYIDNVYNRLICYPSNVLHGPTDLFGYDLESGRLTLTFFLYLREDYELIEIKKQNLDHPRNPNIKRNIKSVEESILENKGLKKFII